MQSHLSILQVFPVLFDFCSENPWLYPEVFYSCFPQMVLEFQIYNKVSDALYINYCWGWEMMIWFHSSACGNPFIPSTMCWGTHHVIIAFHHNRSISKYSSRDWPCSIIGTWAILGYFCHCVTLRLIISVIGKYREF